MTIKQLSVDLSLLNIFYLQYHKNYFLENLNVIISYRFNIVGN